MKTKSLVIAAALLGGLLSTSSFANIALEPLPSPDKFEAPVPVSMIQPVAIPQRDEGSTVTLTMTIDTAGKPHHIRVRSASDQADYQRLLATIAQWRFAPGRRNGVPVPTYIELPLEVVESKRS